MTLQEERKAWAKEQFDSGKKCNISSEFPCIYQHNDQFCIACFDFDMEARRETGEDDGVHFHDGGVHCNE